ncbi:MAG: hypothetical protein IKJ61_01710 [Bacteroidaceae bacterium]|nr:hypothetical protein [Bacteroidaceae bacterium]
MKKYMPAIIIALFLSLLSITPAAAQKNDVKIETFLVSLRQELMAESDFFKVNSVNLKDNVVVIEAAAINAAAPADAVCDVLTAAKKYAIANPGQVPAGREEVLSAMDKAGMSFRMIIADSITGRKHNLDFTAKEFAGFYMIEDIGKDPKKMVSLLSYLPIERVVTMLNSSSGGNGISFSCEGDRFYVIMAVDSRQFLEMQKVYNLDKTVFVSAMSQAVLSLFKNDENSMTILKMVHDNGYKLALRITSPGYSPIVLDVE